MKKLLAALIALALCLSCFALAGAETEPTVYALGNTIEDFTVTTFNGQTVTLSELLKEKDLVVLNIFASWCKPCEREFPEMEEVYQANRDRMEIVSISGDPNDTMEVISA